MNSSFRIALIALCSAAAVFCQNDSKETRTLKLQLKEATLQLSESETALKKAETDYKEAQTLFEKGLYNKIEMAQAEEAYHNATLRYQQASIGLEKTRLTFLNNASYVMLDKAVLYRDKDGYKHAVLTIKNSSNAAKIVDADSSYSGTEKTALLGIDNLTVRILKDGKLIGRPFEYKIASLGFRQMRSVDFTLQHETEEVTVELAYADTVVRLPVFLEKEAREDRILVEATQFSQEGELGSSVTYELALERFADEEAAYALEPVNLSQKYQYEFREIGSGQAPGEGSRVSRIRFKQGVTTKSIQLTINLPREITKDALNQKITFFVLVIDRFAQQRLADLKTRLQGRTIRSEDLDSSRLSYETLELLPHGRAEMEIVPSNLINKVKVGEPVKLGLVLRNTGTISLERVRVVLGLPLDWNSSITPEKDITLDVEGKQKVEIVAMPAPGVAPGGYEIKLQARTQHEGRDIEALPKIVNVEIEGRWSILVGVVLILVLIGLVVGVAIMTIRVTRR
jgi:hypothetical protein